MARILVEKVKGPLPLSQPHLLREKSVLQLVPVSRFTLWSMVKNGQFPAPRKLGPRMAVWPSHQIKEYLEDMGCIVDQGVCNAVGS